MKTDENNTDHMLAMAKMQGYVPEKCILNGFAVMSEVNRGKYPCWGCHADRSVCGGKPYQPEKRS